MHTFRRRAGVSLLAIALGVLNATAGATTPESGAGFSDVGPYHLFAEEIDWLAASGITRGCNPPRNDHFCPNDYVTRGQMAAFLTRALELEPADHTFTDTAGHVFADDVAALAAAGITRGCNPPRNDRFCPDDYVTRGQMAAFLHRALGAVDEPPGTPPATPPTPPPPTTAPPGEAGLRIVTEQLSGIPLLTTEYQARLEATDGVPPYRWTVEAGPAWLDVRADGSVSLDVDALPVGETRDQALTVSVTDAAGSATTATIALSFTKPVAVAAGAYHSCALDEEGAAWCWGDNTHGQLGEGWRLEHSAKPVRVLSDQVFTAITAGGEHTCALDASGRAWCWGKNDAGQLGSGDRPTGSPVPVPVSGDHEFVAIDSGFAYNCAVDSDLLVWCWGSNLDGQLGIGTSGYDTSRDEPQLVGSGLEVVDLAVGGSHVCGVDATGAAWCWGRNSHGQLGAIGEPRAVSPVRVESDVDFVSIATGQNHTCAIDDTGATWCFGENESGQLGLDHDDPVSGPTRLPGAHLFDEVVGSDGHFTCALEGTSALCWGSNNYGQLGIGTMGNELHEPFPVLAAPAFATLDAGEFHTCGIDTSSRVWCWGGNWAGQVGKGDTGFGTEATRPTRVVPGSPLEGEPPLRLLTPSLPTLRSLESYRATLAAYGGSGSYEWAVTGLPEGLVFDEDDGAIVNDPADPAIKDASPFQDPIRVTVRDAEDPAAEVSADLYYDVYAPLHIGAGWAHTCVATGLFDPRDRVYCWGRNNTGQIGNGQTGGDLGPKAALPAAVVAPQGEGLLTAVAQIDGGDGHTCALTTDGNAYCWGAQFDGRLGNGSTDTAPAPVPQPVLDPDGEGPLEGVTHIAVGHQFACAIVDPGDVYCWGNHSQGKVGNGETAGFSPLPTRVLGPDGTSPLTDVTLVAAGAAHACAVSDTSVYCWGNNFQGQLGTGASSAPVPTAQPVLDTDGPLTGVTDLSLGASHSCASTEDGRVLCWGSDIAGQLGAGTGEIQPQLVEVRNPEGTAPLAGVTSLAAGTNHTCARLESEEAVCWGQGVDGQLGTGDRSDSPLPRYVMDPSGTTPLEGVVQLAAGDSHTCALTDLRAVLCWGANWDQQLGRDASPGVVQELPAYVLPGPG